MPKWNPGEVEPRTKDIKTTTPQEHKEGRQQRRLEPAGWWKPIRNKTKSELGRAGAKPDEGGHVIGPDEGPGESEEPGEWGKLERSTGGLPESQGMSKGRGRGSKKSSKSRGAKEAWPKAWDRARRKVGQGYKKPDEFRRG
ncbi:hypothetical protein R3P38DRAFT_2760468 [Favolaschia claudopus]|uniref:Uncharacterized protein n=1 Tax=Favolaschia claudopus TaxID=2862362 RepID=A0AAW0DUD2_9AGAR